MALCFPNQSRSVDTANHRIRFWAYDRSMEVAFFVDMDALLKLRPHTANSEADFLRTFDETREQIHSVAQDVYKRRHNGSHTYFLAARDF